MVMGLEQTYNRKIEVMYKNMLNICIETELRRNNQVVLLRITLITK